MWMPAGVKSATRKIIFGLLERLGEDFSHSNRNDRAGMLHRAWGHVFTNLIQGAYYEFGVYRGDSLVASWAEYQRFSKWLGEQQMSGEKWRREAFREYAGYRHEFYGFDTFDGMPENEEGGHTFKKGYYASSCERVDKKCAGAGMNCRLFKGLFSSLDDETLRGLQPAAILNIDSDLYLSARDALEKTKDKLQQGTILMMDDYNCFSSDDSKGERRALREFGERYPRFRFEPWLTYLYAGQSFICHVAEKKAV